MSTFAVRVERIRTVEPHDNADRLEVATLYNKDYTFVVGKGMFVPGQLVIYFPVDSLLPMSIVEAMGLNDKLAHGTVPAYGDTRLRNRVKTVKLRGVISQGLVCNMVTLVEIFPMINFWRIGVGHDLTNALAVNKYEPPVIAMRSGNLHRLPDMVDHYDIEGAQNHPDIISYYLMDRPVYITEKVEGSHWWATINKAGSISVGQRNYEIVDVVDYQHDWHKVLKTQDLENDLKRLWYELFYADYSIELVTLRGEITGPKVQGNYYNLKDHHVFVFEIEVNGRPIPAERFLDLTQKNQIQSVPIISTYATLRYWLNGRTVKEAADGKSLIRPEAKREGIVIKPMVEHTDVHLGGRVLLKQHSLDYLAKSKL